VRCDLRGDPQGGRYHLADPDLRLYARFTDAARAEAADARLVNLATLDTDLAMEEA